MAHAAPAAPASRTSRTPDVLDARTHAIAKWALPVVGGLVYGFWAAAINRDSARVPLSRAIPFAPAEQASVLGKELVTFGSDAYVHTAAESQAMMAGGFASTGGGSSRPDRKSVV